MAASQTAVSVEKAGRARKDPRPRHLAGGLQMQSDGTPRWLRIVNQDPNRKYIFAYVASGDVEYYSSIGYTPVQYGGPKGVHLAAGRTSANIGDDITFRGMLCMSISNEDAEEIERHGADGNKGQALADTYEKLIRTSGFKKEAFREATARGRSGEVAVGEDPGHDPHDPLLEQ